MPVPAISKRFGIAVRKRRIQAGITQEVLAERAGLHATYIGMVERGIRNPTLDTAARIAKALKAELPGLIEEAQAPKGGTMRKGLSCPGAFHRQIAELLRRNPQGLSSGQIRARLNLAPEKQAQLDRRRRELRKWYTLGKRRPGNEWVYTLQGEREEAVLEPRVNIRVRAAVLWRAHGRCQMCGRTVAQHRVVLVVDHKIPGGGGGSNEEENLWALCEDCNAEFRRARAERKPAACVLLNRGAKERLGALLIARAGQWLPACWLKEVAGVSDWTRYVRRLRAEGYTLQARRLGGRPAGPMTYYSLSRPP